MRNNYKKIANLLLVILLLSFTLRTQSAQQKEPNPKYQNHTFRTSQTKCTITFMTCPNSTVNKFISCSISNCQRHLGTYNCQRSLDFPLQEQQCYKQCCKSDTFNQQQCESVNTQLKQLHCTQDSFMILALIVVSGGLVAFTLIFFVLVLKCNKQPQNQKIQEKSNSLISWVDVKHMDVKCDLCMSYGAVIVTPCNHAYHESCYFKQLQNDQIKCFKCPQKIFSTVRVICGGCREKQFKVKVTKGSILKEIISEATIQHAVKCQKFSKEVYTDIRLTSTGSSD